MGFFVFIKIALLKNQNVCLPKSIRIPNHLQLRHFVVCYNPNITNQELADTLELTVKGIEWQIKKLKEDSKIERIGGAKGGHWEILK